MEKKELNKASEFLKRLLLLLNDILLYSINHSRTKEALFEPYDKLVDILRVNTKLTLGIAEDKITVDEEIPELPAAINAKLTSFLKRLKIGSIIFKDGVTNEEWKKFVTALTTKPEKVNRDGGVDNLFKGLKLKNISVNETGFIKAPEEEEIKEAIPEKKVLIIEDDEGNRELFCDAVKKCGFTTLEAEDGLKGLELIDDNKNADLVILDIKLPKVNGFEILTYLKKQERKIPVIVCTAYSALKDDITVKFYPRIITMDKPISIKDLEDNIKKMIG